MKDRTLSKASEICLLVYIMYFWNTYGRKKSFEQELLNPKRKTVGSTCIKYHNKSFNAIKKHAL